MPSIGFLKKYKEPAPHENIRIDTGVTEGSEISMYYDPMISKLITWGKDRKEAMDLIGKAMDEYVIRGVTHNLGFGQSILRNKSFLDASYTTAFIPDYYPNGYKGDPLTSSDQTSLAIASHYIKNAAKKNLRLEGTKEQPEDDILYMVLKGADKEHDFKIERQADGSFKVTDLESKKETSIKATNFDFEYGSLLRFDADGKRHLV
jgi:propionyl-CoA carboxylase alpha chain